MSAATTVLLLGYLIAAADALPELVQLRHTWRRRSTAGLSYDTQLAWLASWTVWLTYGAVVADGPITLSAALGVAASAILAARMHQLGARTTIRTHALLTVTYLTALVMVLARPAVGGGLLAAVDLAWFGPQLLLAARQRDLTGLSGPANGLNAAISLAWVLYTVAVGHPAAGVWSATTVVFSIYLLHRTRAVRRL
jgi:uncharacterized protein with PQ loop repeat